MGTPLARRLTVGIAASTLLLGGLATAPAQAEPSDSPSSASVQAKPKVRTVTYKRGRELNRDYQVNRALRETSDSFRTYMKRRVRYVTSHDCYELGQVTIYRWRSDGWAVGDEHTGCGGADFIYTKVKGDWRAPRALISQESHRCRTLRRWKVPPALLHRAPPERQPYTCYNRQGRLVRYR